MQKLIANPYFIAFAAGACAVFGFAPFGLFPLPVLSLAALFWLWSKAESPKQAAWLGFAFGMGLFCVGVSWIYVALHEYGHMHPLLAAVATALFAAVNAALPAAVGYVQARLRTRFSIPTPFALSAAQSAEYRRDERSTSATRAVSAVLVMPAVWVLFEWVRGWLFTGFPWLVLGYSQVPHSPLAGYAPVLGVFGVSLSMAVSAGLLLWIAQHLYRGRKLVTPAQAGVQIEFESLDSDLRRNDKIRWVLVALLLIWGVGALLHTLDWTQPQGEPLKVSLLQGNIAQDTKFEESALVGTLETYRRLAQNSDARLIVMPETALPLLRENVPENYQTLLRDHVRQNGGDILIGAFEKEQGRYYNSVYSLGSAESQYYRKDHLVPFGEFVPLRSVLGWFINEVLSIPMGDLASGGDKQPPLNVAGQKIAVNICYEDAFGEEVIRALPQATLLVNVTNDAWYGDSNAAMQHNQLSQMRALETGRMTLRATNTGVTSVIGVDGRIQAMLPQHEEGVLTAQVQGYAGSTPFVRWGNAAVLVLVALMLGVAWRLGKTLQSVRPE